MVQISASAPAPSSFVESKDLDKGMAPQPLVSFVPEYLAVFFVLCTDYASVVPIPAFGVSCLLVEAMDRPVVCNPKIIFDRHRMSFIKKYETGRNQVVLALEMLTATRWLASKFNRVVKANYKKRWRGISAIVASAWETMMSPNKRTSIC